MFPYSISRTTNPGKTGKFVQPLCFPLHHHKQQQRHPQNFPRMPGGTTLDAVIILLEWEKPETWARAYDC